MNRSDEILRALGRIEGELKAQGVQISNGLAEIRALSERVRTIEFRNAWWGGAWAINLTNLTGGLGECFRHQGSLKGPSLSSKRLNPSASTSQKIGGQS